MLDFAALTQKKTMLDRWPFFIDIRSILRYIGNDKYFNVGQLVLERRTVWHMGGAFSEPGTMIDINHELHELLLDLRKLVDLWFRDLPVDKIVACIMHVDDAFIG